MWGDWRDAYFFGTIVIWPPDDARAIVNSLRERYDTPSAAACEAHITLTQPFVRAPSDVDLTVLATVASRFVPMELIYGPLDTFLPNPCVSTSRTSLSRRWRRFTTRSWPPDSSTQTTTTTSCRT